MDTGLRILPLSVVLPAAAVGIPRFFPVASPRRVVRLGLLAMFLGVVVLLGAMDSSADARIVTVPLLLAGLGIGALASQLGAVTVSAVPDEDSPAVGGLQNTATNLGGRCQIGGGTAEVRSHGRHGPESEALSSHTRMTGTVRLRNDPYHEQVRSVICTVSVRPYRWSWVVRQVFVVLERAATSAGVQNRAPLLRGRPERPVRGGGHGRGGVVAGRA